MPNLSKQFKKVWGCFNRIDPIEVNIFYQETEKTEKKQKKRESIIQMKTLQTNNWFVSVHFNNIEHVRVLLTRISQTKLHLHARR